jgi:hypothetical protein
VAASRNDLVKRGSPLGHDSLKSDFFGHSDKFCCRCINRFRQAKWEPVNRSGAWLKYRVNKGQEFVIGGYVPDNPFDSIIVATTKTES